MVRCPLFQRFSYLFFRCSAHSVSFKTDKDKVITHQKRALDQHAVCGKEPQHFIFADIGQLVFQFH